ncbi:hypothetical protein NOVOSPHI9U_110014 [Novosphingobium sp. 9U]|nr:hypothetical protein NOVOSPHI9U_110014 [Novosphingobium sp. 9U]
MNHLRRRGAVLLDLALLALIQICGVIGHARLLVPEHNAACDRVAPVPSGQFSRLGLLTGRAVTGVTPPWAPSGTRRLS